MKIDELAAELLERGCNRALNLDGGGSSSMILAEGEGRPAIVNRPCNQELGILKPRPLPDTLIIRRQPR